MTAQTRVWIGGLISAACGGAYTVAALYLVDPQNFDLSHAGKIFKIAACMAASHVLAYLKSSPLPEQSTVSSSIKTVEVPGHEPVTITTVQETHKEDPSKP